MGGDGKRQCAIRAAWRQIAGEPFRHLVDAKGDVASGERQGGGIHGALLHAGVNLRGRGAGGRGAQPQHRLAQAASGPHAEALPALQIQRRLAAPQKFILRHEGRSVDSGVPAGQLPRHGRMGVGRLAHPPAILPVRHRQERQGQRHQGGILARMVEVAEHRRLEGADGQAVQVLPRLGKRLAEMQIQPPVAAGLGPHLGRQGLGHHHGRARLAPER